MSNLLEKHQATLDKALDAVTNRYAWTAYKESPSSKIHGEERPRQGKANFQALLNTQYAVDGQPGSDGWIGEEVSPYTQEPLGVKYPKIVDVESLFDAAKAGMRDWVDAGIDARTGVCLEMMDRCADQLFENAHATMHTAGQSYIMAFAGSGANALDRGLEAIAYAYQAMTNVKPQAEWARRFGSAGEIALEKRYRLMPRGVAVTVCCATFPMWNGYPAMMASLMTGNPVIVKPHPNTILPVALAVSVCRDVLREAGFDPNLVTLAADTRAEPVTMQLLNHPDTAIIDFTGSPTFGQWIEENCNRSLVYTETAGCNSVVIESTDDLEGMATAVAHSMCQASAQMCTSVQNIFVPKDGIMVNGERVSFENVRDALLQAVEKHLENPKNAAFLCGTLVNDDIFDTIERIRSEGAAKGSIVRESAPYAHPEFENARTATPLVVELDAEHKELYREELFGPISFIIRGDDADHCLQRATTDARERGAITSHIYSTDDAFLEKGIDAYNYAGASVSCNLIGMPINFAAAYSDYHVTGLNPAGNACLTDLAFVSDRFRIVQSRWVKK
jgi:phenylacetic acid degradation protein paaN